jgi:hypothetical protein
MREGGADGRRPLAGENSSERPERLESLALDRKQAAEKIVASRTENRPPPVARRELEDEAAVETDGPGSAPSSGRSVQFAAGRTGDRSKTILVRHRPDIAASATDKLEQPGQGRTRRALSQPGDDQVVTQPGARSRVHAFRWRPLYLKRPAALQAAGKVRGLISEQNAVNTARCAPDVEHRPSLGSHLYDDRKTGACQCQLRRRPSKLSPFAPRKW